MDILLLIQLIRIDTKKNVYNEREIEATRNVLQCFSTRSRDVDNMPTRIAF